MDMCLNVWYRLDLRGVEKSVFSATIVFALIFVLSIVAMLFLPR
jgi:hypothetical protein